MKPLPAWHQSSVCLLMRCPEAFRYRHVEQAEPDDREHGSAAVIGTAAHEVCAAILERANKREPELSEEGAEQLLRDALADALEREYERGRDISPEAMELAEPKILKTARRLAALSRDRRVRAIHWDYIEAQFSWRDQHGREFKGTLDASGVVRNEVELGGVALREGQRVLVDWKNGEELSLSPAARRLSPQFALYSIALRRLTGRAEPVACFLGALRDLDTTSRPKDENGESIPRTIRTVNPAWLEATGLSEEEAAKSKKRPKDENGEKIEKWLKRPNPAYEAASEAPRGPLFHHMPIDYTRALASVAAAIRMAEAGIFPACGAVTGYCRWCDYRSRCAGFTDTNTAKEH